MKHYLLEGMHLVPFDQIPSSLIDDHHKYLQLGYDRGNFLFSGPQIPPHGGFLVARAESREALDELLAEEPFVKKKVMELTRITEFNPAQNQSFLEDWFCR